MIFITMRRRGKLNKKNAAYGTALSVVFWLLLWHFAALLVGEELFLASPAQVLATLWRLMGAAAFYRAIGFSFLRIAIGFFSAMLSGCALAVVAYKLRPFETLMRPFMGFVKSAPVAAITMLLYVMVGSGNMSAIVVFLMVLPLFYSNLLSGLQSVDEERFEAAAVFGMIPSDRFRFIYLPYVSPFFISSCEIGWGTAWKAGVSAEVVAITLGSIGGNIYSAKLSLEMSEIFAYTFAVIAIALLLERLSVWLLHMLERRLTRSGMPR